MLSQAPHLTRTDLTRGQGRVPLCSLEQLFALTHTFPAFMNSASLTLDRVSALWTLKLVYGLWTFSLPCESALVTIGSSLLDWVALTGGGCLWKNLAWSCRAICYRIAVQYKTLFLPASAYATWVITTSLAVFRKGMDQFMKFLEINGY